jgi:uncharacterized protein (TIGR02757 family)
MSIPIRDRKELKDFLEEKTEKYKRPEFIVSDPVSIPHLFNSKEDIEISGFLAATIAWGNRKMIIRNAARMMELLDNSPYEFIMNHNDEDLKVMEKFVHRTFNSGDLIFFISALKYLYREKEGLESIFNENMTSDSLQPAIHELNRAIFSLPHLKRTERHISDPYKGSAAKKINMFLRWMVRKDNKGVDFGIWKSIPASILSCPLDVHSGNVARKLGLITRKQNDAKAVLELDRNLREMDPADPVKYDFALFGLGVFEGFR